MTYETRVKMSVSDTFASAEHVCLLTGPAFCAAYAPLFMYSFAGMRSRNGFPLTVPL